MTQARKKTIQEGASGVFHIWSRCVRRAFLCGTDSYSGRNYNHRRIWILERLKFLSNVFLIDVLAYAILSNHKHLALRTTPEKIRELTEREKAIRWLTVFHKRSEWDDGSNGPTEEAIANLVGNKKRMKVISKRLCSVSWFMRCLKQEIARRANLEDQTKGAFWEGRFKSERLEDYSALVTCMIYIDLNEIRAGMANSPEESYFTSAFRRLFAQKARKEITALKSSGKSVPAELYTKSRLDTWLAPITDESDDDEVSPLTLEEYLTLLDKTGRIKVTGKRGYIPKDLAPILERIRIKPEYWIEATDKFPEYFSSSAGRPTSLRAAASRQGKSWVKGINVSKQFFHSQ